MEMTGSCKAGEQPQSCSVAPFYPRHISQDGPPALGISHPFSIFSNGPSLTAHGIGGTQARRLLAGTDACPATTRGRHQELGGEPREGRHVCVQGKEVCRIGGGVLRGGH